MSKVDKAALAHPALAKAIFGYGGRCRDCADCEGICCNSGLPCDGGEARAAIEHVLRAVRYYSENPHFLDQIAGKTALAAQPQSEAGELADLFDDLDEAIEDCRAADNVAMEELLHRVDKHLRNQPVADGALRAERDGLQHLSDELRRYIYDKTPERREKVVERYLAAKPCKETTDEQG